MTVKQLFDLFDEIPHSTQVNFVFDNRIVKPDETILVDALVKKHPTEENTVTLAFFKHLDKKSLETLS